MKLVGNTIQLDDVQADQELLLDCSVAATYNHEIGIYTGIEGSLRFGELSSGTSYIVLRGLARIGLENPDFTYKGLTSSRANEIISQLCGDAPDYAPYTPGL